MILTKEHYEELIEILKVHEFNLEPEEWTDKYSMILVEDDSFTIIFDNEDVMISFERTCAPDYAAIIMGIILSEFSLREAVVVMENYYVSHEQEKTFFGEEADQEFLNDIYEIAIDDFKTEKKLDCIINHVDPLGMDC